MELPSQVARRDETLAWKMAWLAMLATGLCTALVAIAGKRVSHGAFYALFCFVLSATPLAYLTLLIAGARRFAHEGRGDRIRRGARLLRGAATAMLVMRLLWMISRGPWFAADLPLELEPVMLELGRWVHRLDATLWLAVSAGLLLVGWNGDGVRRLAAPLLLATLLAQPYDLYGGEVFSFTHYGPYQLSFLDSYDARDLGLVIAPLFDLAYAAIGLAVLRRASLGELVALGVIDVTGAPRAMRTAMRAHLAMAALFLADAVLLRLILRDIFESTGPRWPHYDKVWLYGVPLGTLLLGALHARAGLQLAELPLPRTARLWSYAAAMGAIVTAVIWSLELHHGWFDEPVAIFPTLHLGLAAMWSRALVEAGASIPPASPAGPARSTRSWRTLALAGPLLALAVAIAKPADLEYGAVYAAAAALMLGQLALAVACRRLSEQLRPESELPPARVV